MTEAWMIRSGERQRFLETLEKNFYDMADNKNPSGKSTDPFYLLAARKIIEELAEHLRNRLDVKQGNAVDLFLMNAYKEVAAFARSPEEENALLARFVEELFKTGVSSFQRALSEQERINPELIFHAPSAMTKV